VASPYPTVNEDVSLPPMVAEIKERVFGEARLGANISKKMRANISRRTSRGHTRAGLLL